MKEVNKFRFIPILLAVILAVFLLLSSVTTIPAGHTGVVTTFGKVSGTVLGEGLHFKLPFITNVVKIDNRVLKTEVSSSSASKDLQTVNSTIALNYRIGRANSASIYQNIGTDFENVLINPAIQECVKSVTAQFTAEELITERHRGQADRPAERAESRAGPGPHQSGSSAADRTGPCRGRELPAEKPGDHPGNTCHGMDQQMGRQAAQRRFRRLDDVRYFRYHRRSRLRQKRLRSLNTRGSLSAERRFRRSR